MNQSDWESFFNEHRRVCAIKLSWEAWVPDEENPCPVVEVTVSSEGKPGTLLQMTIRTKDAESNQPFTLSPHQATILAEVLQEATSLAYEVKEAFHLGHFTLQPKRRRRKSTTRELEKDNA